MWLCLCTSTSRSVKHNERIYIQYIVPVHWLQLTADMCRTKSNYFIIILPLVNIVLQKKVFFSVLFFNLRYTYTFKVCLYIIYVYIFFFLYKSYLFTINTFLCIICIWICAKVKAVHIETEIYQFFLFVAVDVQIYLSILSLFFNSKITWINYKIWFYVHNSLLFARNTLCLITQCLLLSSQCGMALTMEMSLAHIYSTSHAITPNSILTGLSACTTRDFQPFFCSIHL